VTEDLECVATEDLECVATEDLAWQTLLRDGSRDRSRDGSSALMLPLARAF
jgi:hypothetical protein